MELPDIKSEIIAIEWDLASRGLRVERDLLKPAGITRATWGMWRKGIRLPTFTSWLAIIAAYNQLKA